MFEKSIFFDIFAAHVRSANICLPPIPRCHNIFDLGRRLGLLQNYRVNQNALIRNQIPRALQLGRRLVGSDRLPQHGFRLKLLLRRQ